MPTSEALRRGQAGCELLAFKFASVLVDCCLNNVDETQRVFAKYRHKRLDVRQRKESCHDRGQSGPPPASRKASDAAPRSSHTVERLPLALVHIAIRKEHAVAHNLADHPLEKVRLAKAVALGKLDLPVRRQVVDHDRLRIAEAEIANERCVGPLLCPSHEGLERRGRCDLVGDLPEEEVTILERIVSRAPIWGQVAQWRPKKAPLLTFGPGRCLSGET
jgi:hypothetical protein